jgi:hypothetical protein
MTDPNVWTYLLPAISSLLSALALLAGAMAAYYAAKAKTLGSENATKIDAAHVEAAAAKEHAEATSAKVDGMADDIQRVEKATNSMKDALIVAADKEGFNRGREEGRAKEGMA